MTWSQLSWERENSIVTTLEEVIGETLIIVEEDRSNIDNRDPHFILETCH